MNDLHRFGWDQMTRNVLMFFFLTEIDASHQSLDIVIFTQKQIFLYSFVFFLLNFLR